MRNETLTRINGRPVILMDSISLIDDTSRGAIVICGSHGGEISGAFAARHPPRLVVFNDAGGGKGGAGTEAIAFLDRQGIASAAVSHTSARIGDAEDSWSNGVVSAVGQVAQAAGIRIGWSVRQAAEAVAGDQE